MENENTNDSMPDGKTVDEHKAALEQASDVQKNPPEAAVSSAPSTDSGSPTSSGVTAPSEPSATDAAPASASPEPIKKPSPAENTGDPRDTSQVDSLGNPKGTFPLGEVQYHGERKGETPVFRDKDPLEAHDPLQGSGPRGADVPPEHLSEARKAETAAAETARLQRGMSSTDAVDSIGNPSDVPPGPRGANAPKDSFRR
jgi:hypothetical protein